MSYHRQQYYDVKLTAEDGKEYHFKTLQLAADFAGVCLSTINNLIVTGKRGKCGFIVEKTAMPRRPKRVKIKSSIDESLHKIIYEEALRTGVGMEHYFRGYIENGIKKHIATGEIDLTLLPLK